MIMPIIEVKNITKTYKISQKNFRQKTSFIDAVKDVSFQVFPGDSFGIVGENGSGKSTIAHLMMGINKLTNGEILYQGRNITGLSRSEKKNYVIIYKLFFKILIVR